jgi:uncharacterized membrane protein YgcG
MALPRSVEFTAPLGGHPTTFCCQRFADCLFLVVTQVPTFGTLVEARATLSLDGKESVSIRTVLGERDNDIAALCARVALDCARAGGGSSSGSSSSSGDGGSGGAAAGGGSGGCALPILLSLGLRPENARVEVVRELKVLLEERQPWA